MVDGNNLNKSNDDLAQQVSDIKTRNQVDRGDASADEAIETITDIHTNGESSRGDANEVVQRKKQKSISRYVEDAHVESGGEGEELPLETDFFDVPLDILALIILLLPDDDIFFFAAASRYVRRMFFKG